MARADVLDLIAENPKAHGLREKPELTERTVFVTVRSVGMSEAYQAMSQGLTAEYKMDLAAPQEYQGEKICRYNGVMHRILRVYDDGDKVELTIGRSNHDA